MKWNLNRRETGLGENPELKLAPIGGTGRSISLQDIAALQVRVKAEIPMDDGGGDEPGSAVAYAHAGLPEYLCSILKEV